MKNIVAYMEGADLEIAESANSKFTCKLEFLDGREETE